MSFAGNLLSKEIVNGAPLGSERAAELLTTLRKMGFHLISEPQFSSHTVTSKPPYVKYEVTGIVDGEVLKGEELVPLALLQVSDEAVEHAKKAEAGLCKGYLMQLAEVLKLWQSNQ